jgi:hypothetical protein
MPRSSSEHYRALLRKAEESSTTLARAIRLIEDGLLDHGGIDALQSSVSGRVSFGGSSTSIWGSLPFKSRASGALTSRAA